MEEEAEMVEREEDFDEPADDFDEDAFDASEDDDDEDDEENKVEQKDYSGVPIQLQITAQILPSKNEGELLINVDGKAGPGVSSGSMFGSGTHIIGDQAAAIEEIKQIAKRQEKWFGCYSRPVKTKLVINDVPVDMNTRPITEWFK